MRPTRSRCARCRCRSICVTARSRNRSARNPMTSGCACWSAGAGRGVDERHRGRRGAARRAPSRWPRSRRDRFAGLADGAQPAAGAGFDLIDPACRRSRCSKSAPSGRAAGLGQGVTKSRRFGLLHGIGGMVLATSHGFRGAFLTSPHHGDERSRARHQGGARYDFSDARADLDALERDRALGRRARGRPAQSRKVSTKRVPVVFDRRIAGGLVGHLAGAINGSGRADGLSRQAGRTAVRRHPSSTIRRARPALGRSTARVYIRELAIVEDGAQDLALDCDRATHPTTPDTPSAACLAAAARAANSPLAGRARPTSWPATLPTAST